MFVDALVDAGARVDLVTGVPHYPEWKIKDERYRRGIRWREDHGPVKIVRIRHAVPSGATARGRLQLEASFAALSAPYVRSSSADVIIAVTPPIGAMLASRLGRRGRPVGAIVHDLSGNAAVQSGLAGGAVAQLAGSAEYALLRRADRIGVITHRLTGDLVANGITPEVITEVPIASHVETSDLPARDARSRLGWRQAGMTVVHTGNMGAKQGLENVLEAARLARVRGADVDFVLVGNGNQRQRLEAQAAGLHNVRFLGLVAEAEYPTVLAAADVLLLNERPGVTQMALPSKLTSYVTARRPIVAAVDGDGITKQLLDSYGAALTTPSGDAEGLLAAVERLMRDPEMAARLASGAEQMGAGEFSSQRAFAHVQQFAADLVRAGAR
jgi:glycosyltransferase involved in cell wall biosynthesis